MTAARALGVVGVDRAPLERGDGVLDKTGFIERVGVDRDLNIEPLGHSQAVVYRGGRGAPVFVQLQAHGAGPELFLKRGRQAGVALAQKTQVHRKGVGGLQHAPDMPGAGGAGGGVSARGRPRAAADHGGDAGHQGLLDLLRANEVNMRVDAAGGHDLALARDHLRARADGDADAGLNIGVAGLAYP